MNNLTDKPKDCVLLLDDLTGTVSVKNTATKNEFVYEFENGILQSIVVNNL